MKSSTQGLVVVMTFLCISVSAQKSPFKAEWNNDFKVESEDGRFKLKFGGRLMYDVAYFDQDEAVEARYGEFISGSEFRRARLYSSGLIYGNVEFKLQMDFAGGEIAFKDVFMQIDDIPVVGNFRAGNFKEPFRLEVLTSSRFITFIERSFHLPFVPERNAGIMLFKDELDDRLGWQVGVFRNADESGDDRLAGDAYNLTMHVGGLPLCNSDRSHYMHIGAGLSNRSPKNNVYKVATGASSHFSPKYVSTGSIPDVKKVLLVDYEASVVFGPLSADAEYLTASLDVPGTRNIMFHAWYAKVSYFLTGEHRIYKSAGEGFDRVIPRSNFGEEGGKGAWELAARYSSIDLNDELVSGGMMNEFTFGLNWYLNPASRIMLNYVHADIMDVGNVGIFQTRFQVDF